MADTNGKSIADRQLEGDQSELEQKKRDLAGVARQLAETQKQQAQINDQIKTLEARMAEVKKTADAYVPVATAQQKALDDGRKLLAQKSAVAAASVKEQKEAVDKTVLGVDAEIRTTKQRSDESERAAGEASRNLEGAKADLQAKSDAYALLKQRQKDADSQLKQLSDLLGQAAKAETAGDFGCMYFLLNEASEISKAIEILAPDAYAEQARNAQLDIDKAQVAVCEAKVIFDAKTKDAADARSGLAAKKDGRRNTILAKLNALKVLTPPDGEATIKVSATKRGLVLQTDQGETVATK